MHTLGRQGWVCTGAQPMVDCHTEQSADWGEMWQVIAVGDCRQVYWACVITVHSLTTHFGDSFQSGEDLHPAVANPISTYHMWEGFMIKGPLLSSFLAAMLYSHVKQGEQLQAGSNRTGLLLPKDTQRVLSVHGASGANRLAACTYVDDASTLGPNRSKDTYTHEQAHQSASLVLFHFHCLRFALPLLSNPLCFSDLLHG